MASPETETIVRRIANAYDLYDIRTIATFARLHAEPPTIDTPVAAALSIHLDGEVHEDEFRIVGKFGLKAHEEAKAEKDHFFAANIQLVAYYRLKDGDRVAAEELEPFARTNGMLHLWPYVRTFVQQSCGQLAVPPVVLPPFRVNRPLNLRYGSAPATSDSV